MTHDKDTELTKDGFMPENEDDLNIYCQKCGGCGASVCCEGCPECGYYDLRCRIKFLEEELDKLTDVVKEMSDHLLKVSDASKVFTVTETGIYTFDENGCKLKQIEDIEQNPGNPIKSYNAKIKVRIENG